MLLDSWDDLNVFSWVVLIITSGIFANIQIRSPLPKIVFPPITLKLFIFVITLQFCVYTFFSWSRIMIKLSEYLLTWLTCVYAN